MLSEITISSSHQEYTYYDLNNFFFDISWKFMTFSYIIYKRDDSKRRILWFHGIHKYDKDVQSNNNNNNNGIKRTDGGIAWNGKRKACLY